MRRGLILVLVFLSLISFVYATDCSISSSCITPLTFYASSTFNAHVSSSQTAGYIPLCCAGAVTGTLTASVVNKNTCIGTAAFLMSSQDNAHIAEIGNAQSTNYLKELCLTGVTGLTCEPENLNPYTCNTNYFCLLKYAENGGYTGTNAHVASCNSAYYSKKICCGVSGGGTCGIPGDSCSGTGASTCCQPIGTNPTYPESQYCSYGPYDEQQAGEQGYCCPTGQYWNPNIAQCVIAYVCNPTPCAYDIHIDPYNYFTSNNCLRNVGTYWEACCSSSMYGQQDYYYCRVNVV